MSTHGNTDIRSSSLFYIWVIISTIFPFKTFLHVYLYATFKNKTVDFILLIQCWMIRQSWSYNHAKSDLICMTDADMSLLANHWFRWCANNKFSPCIKYILGLSAPLVFTCFVSFTNILVILLMSQDVFPHRLTPLWICVATLPLDWVQILIAVARFIDKFKNQIEIVSVWSYGFPCHHTRVALGFVLRRSVCSLFTWLPAYWQREFL